jgi:chemotaxis protein histidine kinase CheA
MNDEDKEFLESLRKDFIEESADLLEKCEESLLNYEKSFSENFYNEYMRTLHSIKGSARAVEYDSFASTIHLTESLGQKYKQSEFVEKSLFSLDGIKAALELLKNNNGQEAEITLRGLSEKIK